MEEAKEWRGHYIELDKEEDEEKEDEGGGERRRRGKERGVGRGGQRKGEDERKELGRKYKN